VTGHFSWNTRRRGKIASGRTLRRSSHAKLPHGHEASVQVALDGETLSMSGILGTKNAATWFGGRNVILILQYMFDQGNCCEGGGERRLNAQFSRSSKFIRRSMSSVGGQFGHFSSSGRPLFRYTPGQRTSFQEHG